MNQFRYLRFTFYFLALHGVCFSQSLRLSGKIVDDRKQPVAYGIVSLPDHSQATYTDEEGKFSILVDTGSNSSIEVNCVGYKQRSIATNLWLDMRPVIIGLEPDAVALSEVAITARQQKMKSATLGIKPVFFGCAFYGPGFETGVYLKPPPQHTGYLKEVFVYIAAFGRPDTKFRVHIYDDDTIRLLPRRDISDSNIIVQGKAEGNDWVRVDLSSKKIPVDGGIYVTVEWISGHGNDDRVQEFDRVQGKKMWSGGKHWRRAPKRVRKMNSGPPITFKGMVLGLSKNKYDKVTYSRNILKGNVWQDRREPLIPAIYATYNYFTDR